MQYSGVWILAEQVDGKVQRISYELLTRGRDLAAKRNCALTALIFGDKLDEQGLHELIQRGADKVFAVTAPQLATFVVEPCAACMLKLIDEHRPEIIIAGASSTGRTLMPYLAVKANTGLTADCTVLDIEEGTGNLLQTRPAIGGNIMATIKTPSTRPQMATVRPHSTQIAPLIDGRAAGSGEIVTIIPPAELLSSRVRRVAFKPNADEKTICDAEAIVAVGRGIKKGDNVKLAEKLAASLGAAIGATRDVIDRGWLSYPHQIGLSGKTVNPKLYIGMGVSGSIQHLAGMQTSETIVAINSDPDAQIFKVADFGIVGNLFEVVPAILEKLSQIPNTRLQVPNERP